MNKIEKYFKQKKFARITRSISKYNKPIERGFVVDYSDDFIVLQESDNFRLLGFIVLPNSTIKEWRYNANDAFYEKLVKLEESDAAIKVKTKVELNGWKSLFQSLKDNNKYVIVECQHHKIDSFVIGEIVSVKEKSVSILYFNPEAIFDKKPTKIKFKNITKITFDDRYIDVFQKYINTNNYKNVDT